jgi:hypothetical protein
VFARKFPFPCIVYQKNRKFYFNVSQNKKFNRILITYGKPEKRSRKCWFVQEPKSRDCREPLTLGKKQIAFLELFGKHRTRTRESVAKSLINFYHKKGLTVPKELMSSASDMDYLDRITSRINIKFRDCFKIDLIKLEKGKYVRRANELKIENN